MGRAFVTRVKFQVATVAGKQLKLHHAGSCWGECVISGTCVVMCLVGDGLALCPGMPCHLVFCGKADNAGAIMFQFKNHGGFLLTAPRCALLVPQDETLK